ncbi:hypothetical protein B296_00037849 [Ensete ventricosum]|uniref:Uncharacterized protein n=1 Tax=Ensete ventricosum TaxID=4639 RepID=A0A426X5U0_ENSVE|nr:hypothetical protein B296_00037849 [Ensete ventricosum]
MSTGLATGDSTLRAPYNRPPLRASRYKRLRPRAATTPTGWMQPVVLAGDATARRRHPLGGAAGLAMGGRPCMAAGRPSSSPPSLRKRSKNT